ncbi:MAG: hypothetical protein WDM90_09625 [Ferruginibacter sp.]
MKISTTKLLLVIATLFTSHAFAQTSDATILRFTSSHTSFPDTGRANGHTYNKVLYTAAEHYSDSSVLIIVPPKLKANKKVDVIFWFHGWGNNIDSVPPRYDLIKQFLASNRNAVLVLAETAKDAPDSYGGKLEQKGVFKLLLDDVTDKLKAEKIIGKKTSAGNVAIVGHSGAYRVMAYILQNGGVEIKQTILFDALYSEVDKYTAWIQADATHQFIDIYTDGGGTDKLSIAMIQGLKEKNIAVISAEERDITAATLQNNAIVFMHSLKAHNDVISRPDYNFKFFMENSHAIK